MRLIVIGANGRTGSEICDAVEWAVLGSIERLAYGISALIVAITILMEPKPF